MHATSAKTTCRPPYLFETTLAYLLLISFIEGSLSYPHLDPLIPQSLFLLQRHRHRELRLLSGALGLYAFSIARSALVASKILAESHDGIHHS
ncbi:hypothetical protein BDV96DRAFT_577042 [Lophiotrema nucula]|uniref:Uncharacterized protein n=1 Tax=Lophiotrema nucula TaxID=690887 RepID=A0A6A5Z687_9PLEO|nr:hypothetical protein BDV96DRAFT_577042 [Lophiotrema nucula]